MSKRIIVVDDMLMMAEMVAGILKSIGINDVDVFDNPQKALNEIKNSNDIKIVISDYRMPVIDGNELISAIKKINEDINCILVTSENVNSIEIKVKCSILDKLNDFNSNLISAVEKYY